MNNYEKIKQMTVEEMAILLDNPPILTCDECMYNDEECHDLDIHCPTVTQAHIREWLLQEVE